ncbi:MAG TPA: hypothetical protein VK789_15320 [Bryobacteraceae bacterium]|nr:hypothetical protein [Bryobacteraceae bacterium]
MHRVITHCCALLLGLGVLTTRPLRSQEQAPKKAAPSEQIFSGTITKLTDDAITVVRTVLGKAAVTREFARDGQTRVEGKLREHARVTVRYRSIEDGGYLAVDIIVR